MTRPLSLATLFAALLAVGCDRPNTSVETEELRQKIEELKKERRPPMSRPDSELAAELREAREQLRIALVALEEEQAKRASGVAPEGEGVEQGEEFDLDEVPRAVVVEDGELAQVALDLDEPVAAVLGAKDHQVFFAELGKFGEWFETEEFGFVWQPNEIKTDPNWRPYTRGRWVHSDQGWTWISEEPFGWAVYHYGRWALLEQYGWVWIPGDDWAPAWVAWRKNDDFIGWAPLPPETLYDDEFAYDQGIDLAYDIVPDYYNFIPVEYFYEPVYPHFVPRSRVNRLFGACGNVTRYSTRNRRVHCGGPDFAWVNRHTRTRPRSCRLDLDGGRNRFEQRARPRLHDDRLEVYAPQVDAPWNPAVCPTNVAGHLGRVAVVRGKGRMDRTVVRRHQQAVVRRQERARVALQTKECHEALQPNLERRREAEGRNSREQNRRDLANSEQAVRTARETAQATQRRLTVESLNPKQRAYAELAAQNAAKQLAAAEDAHAVAAETRAGAGAGARQEGVRGGGGRGSEESPSTGQDGQRRPREEGQANREEGARPVRERGNRPEPVSRERSGTNRSARNAQAARLAAEARERLQVQERARMVAEAKAEREQQAAQRAEQAKRVEETRRAEKEQRRQSERALAEARAKAKAEAGKADRRAAQQAAAEDDRRQEAAQQRRANEERARVAQQEKQAAAERAQLAERGKREAAEAKRAQQAAVARENARKAEQRAESDLRRRAAEEEARAEANRRVEKARQRADLEARREAAARQEAAESRRQAEAQRQAQEGKRRAVEERARADGQRRAQEARRQAEMAAKRQAAQEAQRRAAAQQRQQEARQQQESARRRQEESARRQQAESARRQQEESSRRQQAESARRQQEKSARQRQVPQRQRPQENRGRGRRK